MSIREEEERRRPDDNDGNGDVDMGQRANSHQAATASASDDPSLAIENAEMMRQRRINEWIRNILDDGGEERRINGQIVPDVQFSREQYRLYMGAGGDEAGTLDWRFGGGEDQRSGGSLKRLEIAAAGRREQEVVGAGGQHGRAVTRKSRVGDHPGSMVMNHRGEETSLTATTTTTAATSDYLSCCKLPDHLVESVLARLPVESIFRFRSVCRAWNSLLDSPTFLSAYSETAIRHSVWFLLVAANLGRVGRYGHRAVTTYDPQSNSWHGIPLPALLSDLNPYPTAADGGLVCYFVYENRVRTLFVCNPLTKSLRKLPHVLKTCSHISVLKMVMEDRATSSYKVFVVGMVPEGNGNDSLQMEVYDSVTDCWGRSGIIPARYPRRRPVYANGVLYVRCSDHRSSVLTYDVKERVWSKLHAPLPHTLGNEELVQYEGHILLVGVLGENYKIDSICIWELVQQQQNPRSVAWKQVDSMPEDIFMEFFNDREYFQCQQHERLHMKCCQYGDIILCVAFSTLPRGPFKVIAYDLARRRWFKLPESFKVWECRTRTFIEGIIYEPRLDVTA